MKRLTFTTAIALVAACTGSPSEEPKAPADTVLDTDGDGLDDEQESDLGLDPALPDTDGDGLEDGDELTFGTDPLASDTDNDTYSDAAERSAQTDPLDAGSVIYQGGWPYNMEKDALENPTFAAPVASVAAGERFPDLIGVDQFGDLVHLYDFAYLGKPVMLDFSAQWCGPCNALADYMTGAENGFEFPNLRAAIDEGEVYWITVLGENFSGGPATGTTSTEWAALHVDPRIPVLSPPNPKASLHYIGLGAFPTMIWLDETMTVVLVDTDNVYLPADALEAELSGQ